MTSQSQSGGQLTWSSLASTRRGGSGCSAAVSRSGEVVASGLDPVARRLYGGVPTLTLSHPNDPTRLATYGADPKRGGLYLDLVCGGTTVASWDAADLGGDLDNPIVGGLAVLAMHGFLLGGDVDDALDWLGDSHGENFQAAPPPGWPVRRRPRRGVRRVLRVIEQLEVEGG